MTPKTRPKFEWRVLALCLVTGIASMSVLRCAISQVAGPSASPNPASAAQAVPPTPPLPLDTPTTPENSDLVDLEGLLLRIPANVPSHVIHHVDGKHRFGFGFWYPELTPTWLWDQRPPPSPRSFKVLVLTADRTDPSIPLPDTTHGMALSRRPTPSEMSNRHDGFGLAAWGDPILLRPSKKYPELLDASESIEQILKDHPERAYLLAPPRTPEEAQSRARATAEMEKFRKEHPDLVKTWPKSPSPHNPNDITYQAPPSASYELAVRCDVSFCRGDVLMKGLNIQYFLQIADNGHLTDAVHASNRLLETFVKNADNERDRAQAKPDSK
ncbi:hypothetical protein ACQ858_14880 [Variovorax ureilyticus]|uniref:hypothetical protein n=1 Tax=Variovorax ureilyticus TaxID=1836198 RepID=UPI003D66A7EE